MGAVVAIGAGGVAEGHPMVNAKTKVSNTTFMGSMRLNLFIGNYSALKGKLVNRSRYVVVRKD